jgi:tRNA-binding EMAP/Myf-like protein
MITFDDFKKVEIRAGKILSAEKVPNTDKLLKLIVDFGEFETIKDNKDVLGENGTIEAIKAIGATDSPDSISIGGTKAEIKPIISIVTNNVSASNGDAPNSTANKMAETTPMVAETVKDMVADAAKKIPKPRQIISGISGYFPDTTVLIGKTCMFVTNLEPRMIKGFESNGMLFAVSTPEGGFSLLEPNSTIPPGTIAI